MQQKPTSQGSNPRETSPAAPPDAALDLSGWRIQDRPSWVEIVERAVSGCDLAPRPGEEGPPWSIAAARLRAVGERLDEARAAWGRAPYPTDPERDVRVAAWWRRWAGRDPFADQARWIGLLDRPVTSAFRQALAARPLPPDVVTRAIGDLRDTLFYQLLGGREGGSGFAEIAAYALETAPGGPIEPLVTALSPSALAAVASCVSHRGHWPKTLEQALPDAAGAKERALRLRSEDSRTAAAWVELHTALRLVDSWSTEGDPDRDWSVVLQNQGRARGRLRALATREPPERLVEALCGLDSLAARTVAAARRWGWSWAWEALARGFAFDLDQPVIRPCAEAAGPEPLDAEELEILDVWLLLAVLRGRGATVRRWCTTGRADKDGTWGRLTGELPGDLREPDGGLARVRAALAERWEERSRAMLPLLREIAALPEGRELKRAFWTAAAPAWHDAITRPRSGFPTFRRNAAEWLHELETRGPIPPDGEGR